MSTPVPTVDLGDGLIVSAIGFGAMALTPIYGEVDDTQSLATLNHCLDVGVTFIDTANVYGGGDNERLIAKLLKDRRDEVTLATKFGIAGNPADRAAGRPSIRGDAAYVRQCIDESLRRLNIDVVDLYYLHRRDLNVPIEETVGAMAELVTAGKVRHLGLSEVTSDELRAAVAVHPIAAVQSEWSIWSRDVERKVVPTATELGVGFVPYSDTQLRSSKRSPATIEAAVSSAASCSGLSVTANDSTFSSTREARRVPGIGTDVTSNASPRCRSHARATSAAVAPNSSATDLTTSTTARLASSCPNRGMFRRKSVGDDRSAAERTVPVRKPRPSGRRARVVV